MIRRAAPWLAATIALAVALLLLYGPPFLGYDETWAFIWASDVTAGRLPDFEASLAPTPHPLTNALAVALSLTGHGEALWGFVVFLAFGSLVTIGGRLATAAAGLPAGVLAALLLATVPTLAREAAYGSMDLLFLALVMGALLVETERPRAGASVLGLLGLAGLLRPEAWALAIAYLVWLDGRRPSPSHVALTLSAPLIWILGDLIVTGDALHSFHATRSVGQDLSRPTGLGTGLGSLPGDLANNVSGPILAVGALGAVVLGLQRFRTALVAVAVLVIGVAAYLAQGALGLPVQARYLLVPAAVLAVLAACLLTWPHIGRPIALVGTAAAAVAVALAIPSTLSDLRAARALTDDRERAYRDLQTLVRIPEANWCDPVAVPDFRARAVVAFVRESRPDDIPVRSFAPGRRGTLLTYADEATRYVFNLGVAGETPRQPRPAGTRPVGANRSWVAYAQC